MQAQNPPIKTRRRPEEHVPKRARPLDKRAGMGYPFGRPGHGGCPAAGKIFRPAAFDLSFNFSKYAARYLGMVSAQDGETKGEELP